MSGTLRFLYRFYGIVGIILDDYQKAVLETKGNICLCSGRQVGKSTIISIKASEFVINNPKKSVLIISATERQAEEMFIKVLYKIEDTNKKMIKKGKDRPTKHVIKLNNGSIVRCLPTGLSGTGIRGFTIDMLIADEAAFIPDDVWSAVTPMLLTTGGDIILVSTPFGRKGYFYERYHDPTFKTFHVNSEEVILNRKISESWNIRQKEGAIEHLEREKKRMSKNQYAQEYLGQFVDDIAQYFPDALIKRIMSLKRNAIQKENKHYLGVDVARLGDDQSTFVVVDRINKERFKQVECIITTKTRLNQTTQHILELDTIWDFAGIGVDDGGIGVGVFDYLLAHQQTKRKAVAINNRARALDRDDKHKKKLLKEDLYTNLLGMMERGEIELLDDDDIYLSLKSVQYEYIQAENQPTKLRIFGNYTHVAEGLIRAAWLAAQDKRLNIWCRF